MNKLFITFPDGLPGVALLLLRGAMGITVVSQGRFCLADPGSGAGIALGAIAVVAGCLLTLGLITPIAGGIVALGALGMAAAVLPMCAETVFHSGMALLFAGVNLVAVILLGPGRFSVDARLFGRRQIIIPRS